MLDLAEKLYGSYSYLWEEKPSDELEVDAIINSILIRNRIILKILKHQTLSKLQCKSEWKIVLNFI